MTKFLQFRLRGALLLALVSLTVIALTIGYFLRRPVQPVPVSGLVTFDGEPYDKASVGFVLIDGAGEMTAGNTDASGRFRLRIYTADGRVKAQGAMPGTYGVVVERYEPDVQDLHLMATPERYADENTSGLTATVTRNGPNYFVFKLTSMPQN